MEIHTCELDSLVYNTFVLACNSVSLRFNLGSDLVEVEIFLLLVEFGEYTIRLCSGCFKIDKLRLTTCTILNYKGRRVTTPEPLGRKSRPTMFSSSDDLPDDWVPKFHWIMYLRRQFWAIKYVNGVLHLWSYRLSWWASSGYRRAACRFVLLFTFCAFF